MQHYIKYCLVHLSPADTPDAPRKLAVSTQSLASGTTAPNQGGVQPLSQRKRLLRAPTLAELDSSESDVRCRTLCVIYNLTKYICSVNHVSCVLSNQKGYIYI